MKSHVFSVSPVFPSPSLRLALTFTCAAFSLSGCVKHPLRPEAGPTPAGPVGNLFAPPGDRATATIADTHLPYRGDPIDATRHDRATLQDHALLFDYDQSDIRSSERDKLRLVKAYLDAHPGHKLILEGHCDWRGTAEYNLNLGDRRASATKNYLESLGVSPHRLDTLSKGSIEAPRDVETSAMKKDRRVEFVVVN